MAASAQAASAMVMRFIDAAVRVRKASTPVILNNPCCLTATNRGGRPVPAAGARH